MRFFIFALTALAFGSAQAETLGSVPGPGAVSSYVGSVSSYVGSAHHYMPSSSLIGTVPPAHGYQPAVAYQPARAANYGVAIQPGVAFNGAGVANYAVPFQPAR